MTLISRGYSNNSTVEDVDQDWELFSQNIDLLLNNEQKILNCTDYFFCNLSFAYSSWPYVSGDGQLCLGYLLLGLTTGQLIEHCPTCNGIALITSFGGSPLTGSKTGQAFALLAARNRKDSNQQPSGNGVSLIS